MDKHKILAKMFCAVAEHAESLEAYDEFLGVPTSLVDEAKFIVQNLLRKLAEEEEKHPLKGG